MNLEELFDWISVMVSLERSIWERDERTLGTRWTMLPYIKMSGYRLAFFVASRSLNRYPLTLREGSRFVEMTSDMGCPGGTRCVVC